MSEIIDIDELLSDGPSATPADLISEAELADLLGITSRRIRDLTSDGIFPRRGAARYGRREAVRSYAAWLRKQASGKAPANPELQAERLRFERERADKLAAQNAATRRDLLPASEVARTWSATLRDLRASMLAIPSRVGARLPHLTAHDLSEIDREIRDALAESADAR